MAMIQCSECGNSVASKANSCPNCGAPIRSRGRKTQTIEETSKTWKTHQLFGGLATLVGLIGAMVIGGSYEGGGPAAMIFGAIGIVGILWFFGARMMAWWHHG